MHRKKNKKFLIFFFCFFVATLVAGTAVLFAKYHTIQAQKGVAVASEMYFTSNYLEHTQSEEYATKYNMEKWEGDQSLFKIQLRNYENKLLYNKNIELTCEVTFQLANAPKEGFRYVVYDLDNQQQELTDAETVIKLSNIVVPSGTASEAEIKLGIIKSPDLIGDSVDSDDVMVTATIVSPEYATSLGPLKAKLKATTSNEAFSYRAKFKIADEINDTNLTEQINYASGFVYILNTVGGVESDEVKLRISWNHDLLKLNEFDPIFDTAQIKQSTDSTKSYIEFTPKLNARREFIFYKTSQFTDESVKSKMDFENLVKIESGD